MSEHFAPIKVTACKRIAETTAGEPTFEITVGLETGFEATVPLAHRVIPHSHRKALMEWLNRE